MLPGGATVLRGRGAEISLKEGSGFGLCQRGRVAIMGGAAYF